jgi:hypothetical protein
VLHAGRDWSPEDWYRHEDASRQGAGVRACSGSTPVKHARVAASASKPARTIFFLLLFELFEDLFGAVFGPQAFPTPALAPVEAVGDGGRRSGDRAAVLPPPSSSASSVGSFMGPCPCPVRCSDDFEEVVLCRPFVCRHRERVECTCRGFPRVFPRLSTDENIF